MFLLHGVLLLHKGELLPIECFSFAGCRAIDGTLLRAHLTTHRINIGGDGLHDLLVGGITGHLPSCGLPQVGLNQAVNVEIGLPYPTADFLHRRIGNGRTCLLVVLRAVGCGTGGEQDDGDKGIDDFCHSFFEFYNGKGRACFRLYGDKKTSKHCSEAV